MFSSFLISYRSLPPPFWVLVGATFVNRFGVFVVPFLTIFVTRNGNSALEAGYCVAAYAAGGLGAAWLGGWLADRIGRNVTMGMAAIGGGFCMLLMSQCSDWRMLAGVAFLTGLVMESSHAPTSALIQDLVPLEHRMFAYAVHRFAINLGWSFGPAVAGFLAERSFFWLFAVDGATSMIFGLMALAFLPSGTKTERAMAGWGRAWTSIRVNRPFLALVGSCVLVSWLFRQAFMAFPLHFEQSGLPIHWCGVALALNGVLVCLLEIPLAAFTRGWPVRRMLALGYITMGGSFLLITGTPAMPMFFMMITFFTFGEILAFSRQQAYAASLAPEDMRGRYAGFLGFAWGTGAICSGLVGMALFQVSPTLSWITNAGLGLAAAALLVYGTGRPQEIPSRVPTES